MIMLQVFWASLPRLMKQREFCSQNEPGAQCVDNRKTLLCSASPHLLPFHNKNEINSSRFFSNCLQPLWQGELSQGEPYWRKNNGETDQRVKVDRGGLGDYTYVPIWTHRFSHDDEEEMSKRANLKSLQTYVLRTERGQIYAIWGCNKSKNTNYRTIKNIYIAKQW